MSDLRQKLQLIENTTNEAATSAGEKAAEKFGLQTAASALRGTAAKARAKLAAGADKVAAATDKLPGGATRASKRAKLRKVKQHVASIKQHVRANELKAAAEAETNLATKAALEKQAQEATQEAERLSQAAGSIDREIAQAVVKEPEMVALQANKPEALQAAITSAEKSSVEGGAAAEKAGGYAPMTRDSEAVAGLNAEQKQLSDYFAKPENHVVKDGKVYGRDPNNVKEFVELDAKTLLPKGQIGVNREIFHAAGPLNRELEALEKLGPREVEKLETKALNSALTDAEKAEVKSGGIINWIKKNPKKSAMLGLLAGIVTAGTIASLMSSEEEKKDEPGKEEKPPEETGGPEGLPGGGDKIPGTSSDLTQTTPADLEKKILNLIAELEKEPTCQADVVKLKADLARVKSGAAVAPTPTPTPADATAADPKWMAAIEAIKKATGKSDQEVRDMVATIRLANPAATPEQTQAQLAVGTPPVPGKDTAAPPVGAISGQLANPGQMPADMAAQMAAQMGTPAAGGSDIMTGRDITGKPVMKGSPADVSGKDPLKIGGLAENDELARWLKIARG